jgi:hypothetical protein
MLVLWSSCPLKRDCLHESDEERGTSDVWETKEGQYEETNDLWKMRAIRRKRWNAGASPTHPMFNVIAETADSSLLNC